MKQVQCQQKMPFKASCTLIRTLLYLHFKSFLPMNKDWLELLKEALAFFQSNIINKLNRPFYPDQTQIFRAFKECPLEELKVVILGQD